jgi:GNAT superfamily N-acetyltransferase
MLMMQTSFQTVVPEHPRMDVLLPDLYQSANESMNNLFGVRWEGKIIGCLGLFPIPVNIFGHRTIVAGIGGVCTDPKYRGQGVMESLMSHAMREMECQGYNLAVLGGDRKRYHTWGFEVVMGKYCFSLDSRSPGFLKYSTPHQMSICQNDPDWDILYRQACVNPELTLCSREIWQLKYQRAGHHLYWINDPEGAHLLIHETGSVSEIRAWGGHPERVGQLTTQVIQDNRKPLQIFLSPVPDPYLPVFRELMTDCFLARSGNYAVVNLAETLRMFQTYLNQRVCQFGLCGEAAFHVTALGNLPDQIVILKADGRELIINVLPENTSKVFKVNRWELVDLLFNPPRLGCIKFPEKKMDWVEALFPLPFNIPAIYHV